MASKDEAPIGKLAEYPHSVVLSLLLCNRVVDEQLDEM